MVHIDIVSDVVCPWCWIGKRRLEKAISSYQGPKKGEGFTVRWRPFQLNPQFPLGTSVNKRQYYREKFGEARAEQIATSMAETFAAEGLTFTMDGETGNTFNAHRVIAAAGEAGPEVQDRVVEALFRSYFTEGKYINDPAVLRAAAEEAGLANSDKVVGEPDAYKAQVQRELEQHAGRHRVTGVPLFVLGGRFALSGAQDPAAFHRAFERLAEA